MPNLEGDVQQAHIDGVPVRQSTAASRSGFAGNVPTTPAGTLGVPAGARSGRPGPAGAAEGERRGRRQGIEAGAVLQLVAAMRSGATYANVHSTDSPAVRSARSSTAAAVATREDDA